MATRHCLAWVVVTAVCVEYPVLMFPLLGVLLWLLRAALREVDVDHDA